uniref:Steroid 5-alpha reductase C-terminal domain-containing protein n=1 Tax=Plectus sambesii TaxID=2011161 RepID=A0A914UMR7_9BILA
MLLKELLASALGINWTGWAIASWLKTEKFYDITGSATFTYVTLKTLGSAPFRLSWRQKLQGACVLAWTASAEITMWFALFLTSSSSFHSPYDYLTILGPIFNALLITKISGIPMIQARGQKLWGHQPEYQRYLQQTKRLIPGVW